MTAAEKREAIRLVEASALSVRRTLREVQISASLLDSLGEPN
jgi:hypothetical protein